ncbi:uncharacterized protein LOC130217645 [Danio aesculapii]|uniref:uncharacterized protein LOC130217645 n=1 Tax=Danio aesculapii TaxID=1142201 RepID=UPI0024C0626F|nr:uncharacterized protein LOC130217645 [Danio aesculapii]XP_056305777.1 uncharacterized protein LOC130217645 [Danio aesculapii]
MDHLNISLVILLIFCSSSAGKTFWTHLGTRCIEDCKTDGGAYKCKTIDKDGQCKTMYCSPQGNLDYLGRQCSENSKCGKHGNDYYSCKIDFFHWGYCGLVTDIMNHYGSYTGAQCYDHCEQRGEYYYWCHTDEGWDYCSPNENIDYKNRPCKEGSPCEKRNNDYKRCAVEGGLGYCGLVEPKMFIHRTYTNDVCIDECRYSKSKEYYWCHTANSWDYCSPEVDITYNGKPCRSDHSCDLNGYSYNWCLTSETEYDYCGPIEPEECTYVTFTHRSRRTPENHIQEVVICTRVDKEIKIITTFTAEPASSDFTDGIQFRHEVEKLTSQWHNGYLMDQARSNLIHSANVHVDLQSPIIHNNQTYYNLQVLLKKPQTLGESTILSQVLVPKGVPTRYIRRAFLESLKMRARIYIDVATLNDCVIHELET